MTFWKMFILILFCFATPPFYWKNISVQVPSQLHDFWILLILIFYLQLQKLFFLSRRTKLQPQKIEKKIHLWSLKNRPKIIFDFQNGISDKTDNALRHLCAKLIRIFVQWSFKRTKIDIRRHRVPVNVEAVIQKICFFCVLPCSYNKLGNFSFFL